MIFPIWKLCKNLLLLLKQKIQIWILEICFELIDWKYKIKWTNKEVKTKRGQHCAWLYQCQMYSFFKHRVFIFIICHLNTLARKVWENIMLLVNKIQKIINKNGEQID